jgi:hypothetical protein
MPESMSVHVGLPRLTSQCHRSLPQRNCGVRRWRRRSRLYEFPLLCNIFPQIYHLGSVGEKSAQVSEGWQQGGGRAVLLSGNTGGWGERNPFPGLFQPSDAAHIPWLVAPSSFFRARNLAPIWPCLLILSPSNSPVCLLLSPKDLHDYTEST